MTTSIPPLAKEHPKAPPRRHFASALRFFALTSLGLVAVELGARWEIGRKVTYWQNVDQAIATQPVHFIFIGTSRTAASIDVEAFGAAFPTTRSQLCIINAGAGWSTAAEYYLALRNSLHDHPERFRNCTLFIEAPGQMPDESSWQDPWAHPDRPEILTPLLRSQDVARYWSTSSAFEGKLGLTADWICSSSAAYSHRHAFGALFNSRLHHFLEAPAAHLTPSVPDPTADLATTGGIRSDSAGVALARQMAYDVVGGMKQNQHPVDWEHTVVADIVQLTARSHVRVIFFSPPLHSLFQAVYDTPTRRADREAFAPFAAQWNTPVVTPDFPTTDDDFPDIWHLRHSLAPAYTRALVRALAIDQAHEKPPALSNQTVPVGGQ